MQHDSPPPQETGRPETSAKPRRTWSKPSIRKMSYVRAVADGTTQEDVDSEANIYIPTAS